jgi:hypothetical protein
MKWMLTIHEMKKFNEMWKKKTAVIFFSYNNYYFCYVQTAVTMRQQFKIMLFLGIILCSIMYSFADRGLKKKNKNKVILNINSVPSFKSALTFNMKNGLKYKGLTFLDAQNENAFITTRSIVSFQKGNTIYLVPNSQKVIIPEITQGYTGMKLIIKSSH